MPSPRGVPGHPVPRTSCVHPPGSWPGPECPALSLGLHHTGTWIKCDRPSSLQPPSSLEVRPQLSLPAWGPLVGPPGMASLSLEIVTQKLRCGPGGWLRLTQDALTAREVPRVFEALRQDPGTEASDVPSAPTTLGHWGYRELRGHAGPTRVAVVTGGQGALPGQAGLVHVGETEFQGGLWRFGRPTSSPSRVTPEVDRVPAQGGGLRPQPGGVPGSCGRTARSAV